MRRAPRGASIDRREIPFRSMKRRGFKGRRELKRTKIEIIPMIDTMFFLLVFFMLSSLALTRINGLKVNLPRTSTVTAEPTSKMMLTITPNRVLLLNQRQVTVDNLES